MNGFNLGGLMVQVVFKEREWVRVGPATLTGISGQADHQGWEIVKLCDLHETGLVTAGWV